MAGGETLVPTAASGEGRKPEVHEGGPEMTVPPYGAYRVSYGEYERAQFSQLGSGRLGGWSYATSGGLFEERPPGLLERAEERAPAPRRPRSWEEIALEELRQAA